MMMSEFVERTNYEPSWEEYGYIEDSYYEFNGDKNAFCKQWLKDKKSGNWEKELRLRKMLNEQRMDYEKQLAEKEDTIEFYRPYFNRAVKAELKAKILDLVSQESVNVKVQFEGSWRKFENVRVVYVGIEYNNLFDFVNFIPVNGWRGWTQSVKMDGIEAIERI